jgi:hypothetical protein
MKILLALACIGLGVLWLLNQEYKDRLYATAERGCVASKAGERKVSEKQKDGTVSCTTIENVGHGMVPKRAFAEVWASR